MHKRSFNFHVFGCVYFILNQKDQLLKFMAKADEEIFWGYSSICKTFRVFILKKQVVEEFIHLKFDEYSFFKDLLIIQGQFSWAYYIP